MRIRPAGPSECCAGSSTCAPTATRGAIRRKLASGCCPLTRVQGRRTASRGGAGTCPIRRQRSLNRADGMFRHCSGREEMGMDMDEIRMILAVRALRKLLNKGERGDGGELVATYRALSEAIVENKPMTRKNHARVAEYLREAAAAA